MWLRDSAAQVMQYLYFADDPDVQALIKGVLKRQVDLIITDTYANAFMCDAYQVSQWDGKYLTDRWGKLVWERKFELDSLCYPMFLACKYYEKTGDKSIFTHEFLWAFEQIK
jgi:meiotically up-regulated gene 157 (Mug157) protein